MSSNLSAQHIRMTLWLYRLGIRVLAYDPLLLVRLIPLARFLASASGTCACARAASRPCPPAPAQRRIRVHDKKKVDVLGPGIQVLAQRERYPRVRTRSGYGLTCSMPRSIYGAAPLVAGSVARTTNHIQVSESRVMEGRASVSPWPLPA